LTVSIVKDGELWTVIVAAKAELEASEIAKIRIRARERMRVIPSQDADFSTRKVRNALP